jgi:hypothetical protein
MSATVARFRQRSAPHIALMLLASSALSALTLAVSPAALAGDCILGERLCNNLGTIGTGGNGPNPGGSHGNPGTPGTGGSGSQLPVGYWSRGDQGYFETGARPPAQIGGRGGAWTDDSNVYHYQGKCDGNITWQDANGRTYREPHLGWSWWLIGYTDRDHIDDDPSDGVDFGSKKKAVSGGYECIEPPRYYDTTYRCAAYADAYLIGPIYNSDTTVQDPRRDYDRQLSAFEKSGRRDVSKCQDESFYFGESPRPWGQYQMVGQLHSRRCTIRTYYTPDARTGRIPSPEVLACAGPTPSPVVRDWLELFCEAPYVHTRWHRPGTHSFTTADCMGGGSTWDCGPQVSQKPTFAGRRGGPFEVLDDGKQRRAAWATVQPTGDLRNIRQRRAALLLEHGSSPVRAGESKNGSNQPYFTNPKNESTFSGWRGAATGSSNTAWDLAFLAPGEAGHPWAAAPRWTFKADFLSYIPDITWDLGAGSYTYELAPVWITAPAKCDGQPVEVDVHRARNSSGPLSR